MPRYFFDLRNERTTNDGVGLVMPDCKAAKEHALAEAREMICGGVWGGKMDLRHRIDVRDEAGAIVAHVYFEDAVAVVRSGQRV